MPQCRAATGASARIQHDITRQVPRFTAESVSQPGTHCRQAERRTTALHQQLPRVMVELLGVQRPDHQNVVSTRTEMRQQVGELHAAFAVLLERSLRAEQRCGVLLDERETHFLKQVFRQRLATQFVELRLRVEQVELRGCSGHKDEDAGLRRTVEVRLLRLQRIHR